MSSEERTDYGRASSPRPPRELGTRLLAGSTETITRLQTWLRQRHTTIVLGTTAAADTAMGVLRTLGIGSTGEADKAVAEEIRKATRDQ